MKGLPKTKRCNSVGVTVSVRFRFGFGVYVKQPLMLFGVSTQLQSSGLVAHENSTFRNLALAVSGPFMVKMGALFDFKCTRDSTLVYVCQADAEKCMFLWTILSQTPRRTPQVTYDAGWISARIF